MGIRQRARWFHGLYYCTFLVKNDLPIRANFILTCFVLSWWSLFSLTLLKLVFQLGCSSNGVGLIKGTLFAMAEVFSFNYVLGFLMNFSPYGEGVWRWLCLFYMHMTLLLPMSCMELGGVLHGMYLVFTQARGFHIVQKEKEPQKEAGNESEEEKSTTASSLEAGGKLDSRQNSSEGQPLL